VNPFITNLEKPLENLNLGDENSIYLMEEELTEILLTMLENRCSEIINLLLSKDEIDIPEKLREVFELKTIKASIAEYFESFKVTDLFSEIFEIERNRTILDKQEFYLYFCDVTFRKAKYPIFYIPFSITKNQDVLSVELDSEVYINKKALEFIVQEYNVEKQKGGHLKTIAERIIYLAQHEGDFADVISLILSEISNFLELNGKIDVSKSSSQVERNLWARISNTCYVALFDKSDEALINDYENILSMLDEEDNPLAGIFNRLIEDFIHKEPLRIDTDLYQEWDDLSTGEKLVFPSPIPLNSEQRQILSALQKEDCKYMTVQGPPGTGKSHTITAIVCNAVLKNQSILVLSDKKEALDVVEDKITEAMNRVRHDQHFQNPILRLGKTGSTYGKILTASSVDKIRAHYRAIKKDYGLLAENIEKMSNTLKEDLESEIDAASEIELSEIQEYCELEKYFSGKECCIDFEEVYEKRSNALGLVEVREVCQKLRDLFVSPKGVQFLDMFGLPASELLTIGDIRVLLALLAEFKTNVEAITKMFETKIRHLKDFQSLSEATERKLEAFLKKYSELRNPVFGFLFKSEEVMKIDNQFIEKTHCLLTSPHQHLRGIRHVLAIIKFCNTLKQKASSPLINKIDFLRVIHQLLISESSMATVNEILSLQDDLDYVESSSKEYPQNFERFGIEAGSISTYIDNALLVIPEAEFSKAIRLLVLHHKISDSFSAIHKTPYVEQKKAIEEMVTAQMTYLMDERLVNFYFGNTATAKAIKTLIQKKEKFPKEEFSKLRQAFPCILAGIRDYAEFIPLEPEIFDLVIIDEASQVSIAQAFPALLRAKKVLILGDRRQFSNVKAAHARTDTNTEYLKNLEDTFQKFISSERTKIVRLRKFNIQTSILDFFEFIHNFDIQLKKYFRGYKEIISYSNKYFYQESLEVMKIRGKPIDDVLKFTFIKDDGKMEMIENTNTPEVDFILAELQKLKESNSNSTVGIITPHTNQQKILVDIISRSPESEWYFDNLKLKIMTFDTCQGEERDIIYYSMVASPRSDRLWGVFISDLSKQDSEEEGQIKAQRLNVGFSRARETMHFVLSKPLEDFRGSIGEALRHYSSAMSEARKEKSPEEVDQSSPMEERVLHWFYQTNFWKENQDRVEFQPQFELGKYLKQLDMTYSHPNYKVDFLLVFTNQSGYQSKIIIEYDGFREHFGDRENINEFNIGQYYSEGDLYREKVLESYGYKFLRINKFNVGKNPIETLDKRIQEAVKKNTEGNFVLNQIHQTIDGLNCGDVKECRKCKEIKPIVFFYNPTLISCYSKICNDCKSLDKISKIQARASSAPVPTPGINCPRCNSQMILRNGRRGKFYGCKRFPYCKGTRQYLGL